MTDLTTIGGRIINLGGAFPSFASATDVRTHSLMSSTKPGFGDQLTAPILAFNPMAVDIYAAGSVRYRGFDMQNEGHVDASGKLLSLPNDSAITEVRGHGMFNGVDETVDYYDGDILVHEVIEGSIGTGNSLSLVGNGTGVGAKVVINSTPTAYRCEYTINDTANILNPIPSIGISSVANFNAGSGVRTTVYLKRNEALATDVANNPYKGWELGFRQWLDHFDVLRVMDWTLPMTNCATHPKDWGRPGDGAWAARNEPYGQDSDFECNSPRGRQGMNLEIWGNLCESGSPTARPWQAWYNIAGTLCSPVRKAMRTYINPSSSSREYYIDGVLNTRNLSDSVFWLDPSWVDLSSVTVSSGPTNGTISVNTTSGVCVFNPREGGSPHTHTSGEVKETITITANRINYDGTNTPSVGASETFDISFRVIHWGTDGGNPYYLCRIDGSSLWADNKAWFLDANRWQSCAYSFVDQLVASGYSTSRALWLEWMNEPWNAAKRFEQDRNICVGAATAFDADWDAWRIATSASTAFGQSTGGPGVMSAIFRKYVEDELSDRALSYDLRWVVGCQMAVPGDGASSAQGHRFIWEDEFGLTPTQATAKMQSFYIAGAYYPSGAHYWDRPTDNLTGLSDTANDDELLDRFDGTKVGYSADSSELDAEIIAWTNGASNLFNNKYLLDREIAEKILVTAEGGNWAGAYEDGDHDNTDVISSGLRSSIRTNSAGQTFSEWTVAASKGQRRADIIQDGWDKRIAEQSDTILCVYGGQYTKSIGEPWATDWWQNAATLEVQKIRDFGRGDGT